MAVVGTGYYFKIYKKKIRKKVMMMKTIMSLRMIMKAGTI